MKRRSYFGWVVCVAFALCAARILPAQVTISPGNSVNLDPTPRPQQSTGQTTTFSVQYFATTSGLDQKFTFTCQGFGGITVTVAGCPSTRMLTSNAPATTVSVAFSTGAAGTGWMTVQVDQTLPNGLLTATGRRDFTIAAPSASLALLLPTAANMYQGVGAAATETFTLKNTGPATTTYTLAVASGSCTGVLTACSVSPASVSLAPNATQTISAPSRHQRRVCSRSRRRPA